MYREWDEMDELLQVERPVDDRQKLYQTMPAGVVLRPLATSTSTSTSISTDDFCSSDAEKTLTNADERDSGFGKKKFCLMKF